MIGHGGRYCSRAPVCCSCAKGHEATACPTKDDINAACCVNCARNKWNPNHHANDIECPARALFEQRKNERGKKTAQKTPFFSSNIKDFPLPHRTQNKRTLGNSPTNHSYDVLTHKHQVSDQVTHTHTSALNSLSYVQAVRMPQNGAAFSDSNNGSFIPAGNEPFSLGELFSLLTAFAEQIQGKSRTEQIRLGIQLMLQCQTQ